MSISEHNQDETHAHVHAMAESILGAIRTAATPEEKRALLNSLRALSSEAGVDAYIAEAEGYISTSEQEQINQIEAARMAALSPDAQQLYTALSDELPKEDKKELDAILDKIDPDKEYVIKTFDNNGNVNGETKIKGSDLQEAHILKTAWEKKDKLSPAGKKALNKMLHGNENESTPADRVKDVRTLTNAENKIEGYAYTFAKTEQERGTAVKGLQIFVQSLKVPETGSEKKALPPEATKAAELIKNDQKIWQESANATVTNFAPLVNKMADKKEPKATTKDTAPPVLSKDNLPKGKAIPPASAPLPKENLKAGNAAPPVPAITAVSLANEITKLSDNTEVMDAIFANFSGPSTVPETIKPQTIPANSVTGFSLTPGKTPAIAQAVSKIATPVPAQPATIGTTVASIMFNPTTSNSPESDSLDNQAFPNPGKKPSMTKPSGTARG